MEYQTLYRKYRPKTFELVYGQNTIVKTLKNVIKNNKLCHAYLFTGPRGTGKTSCAKLFAKTINCLNNETGDACNNCINCISFNQNSNPDIIEIDAASNNGVDEIREIRNKVNLVPSISKYKVYIIDEVHMLSIGAFNALLKTLEEPPEYVIFILATTEPQKIPATVISRCQRFDFKSISKESMNLCLKNIAKKENIMITEEAITEIINNSKGGMRDAIGMLDQASSFSEKTIELVDIDELTGSISEDETARFLENIISQNYKKIINYINNWENKGKDFLNISRKIINIANQGIIFKKINLKYENEKILNIFKKLKDKDLYKIIDSFTSIITKLQTNNQKSITFEVEIIKLMDAFNKLDANVPRETLENNFNSKNNVPRETLDDNKYLYGEKVEKLKKIRINNILKEATKKEINYITELWQNLNEYLIDSKYKLSAGILINSKPIAASNEGIIIALPTQTELKRLESNFDISKELIKLIYNNEYSLVYITNEYWNEIRPNFVEKAKNKLLQHIDESNILLEIKKIKNKNSVNDFNELIEMEE